MNLERPRVGDIVRARDMIAVGLSNDHYRVYAGGKGPLPLELVPHETQATEEFEKIFQYLGWPSEADVGIEPIREYKNDAAFLNALLAPGKSPELQNFINFLTTKPDLGEIDMQGGNLKDLHEAFRARIPALHRLYAIMPDTPPAVRTLLQDIALRHHNDPQRVKDELSLGVNGDLVTAMHMVYNTMGRLVTIHDARLQRGLLYPGLVQGGIPDVVSAFETLRA